MKSKIDYRYYILIGLTVVVVAFGFFFPNALPRLWESVRNIFTTIGHVFYALFMPEAENPVAATLLQMPELQFSEPYFEPISVTFDRMGETFEKYFRTFFYGETLCLYASFLLDILLFLVRWGLLGFVLFIGVKRIVSFFMSDAPVYYTEEERLENIDKDSKALKGVKKAYKRAIYPTIDWVKEFIGFLRSTPFLRVWACILAVHFNLFAIVADGLSYFLYLAGVYNVESIWSQIEKFIYDISPMLQFVPGWVWIVVGSYFFSKFCRALAYAELYHKERCNRGFINERGVVSIVYGNMGAGKTALITDMALSAEVELRDRAFRIILESDMKFPLFKWATFRETLKQAIEKRDVVDIPSCKRWVAALERQYVSLKIAEFDKSVMKALRRHADKIKYKNCIFDYDESFGMTYNDQLTVTSIWQAIEDYACAYFVYTIQSSLIVSNYSIRVDSLLIDTGNMPVWDADFFKRDSRLIDSFSRHSKILDFDMLRLGTLMLKNNPMRNAFGFGVYVISEIDKERKNGQDTMTMKVKTEECNQRTDLFNACLKMARHACVIANTVFIKILCDLQRPEDWGAGGREVGEVIYIESESDMSATLPLFSPFWIFEWIYSALKKRYDAFYVSYIAERSDNTFWMTVLKVLFSALDRYFLGINNTFGAQTLHLEVEDGRMDRKAKKRKYYRMPKKIYSGRYKTNCLSAIFQQGEVNRISIADFIEYAEDMASAAELQMQHSHFYKERLSAVA